MIESLLTRLKVFLCGKEREFSLVLGCNHLLHEGEGKWSVMMNHVHFLGLGLV